MILAVLLFMFSTAAWAALAAGLASISWATPVPIIVHPGNVHDIIINAQDTLNGTLSGGSTGKIGSVANVEGTAQLGLAFQNNYAGGAINAYITGEDTSGNIVFVTSNGQFY